MLQALILLKPRDVPMRVALRNSIAVVAPLAVGVALDQIPAGLAIATGALNTMFTDLPGPYRQRMQRMLIAAASAGLSALAGVLVGPHTAVLVAMAVLFGFAGGMLVALGPVAARTGLTSMIVMLITADMRLAPAQAPGIAALIFAGGMLQMLFAVAAWPLQRYRPERFALAQVLQQLADVARTRPDALQTPPVSLAAMDAMRLLHGRHRARGAAVQAFRVIAELCERVRVDLLSLGDLHARLPTGDGRAALEHVLDGADTLLRLLADALCEARPPRRAEATLVAFDTRVEALVAAIDASTDARERRLLRICAARAQSLAGQLRALTRNADWASSRGEVQAELAEARLPAALRPGNPLQTLRANLALSSIAMRHALRCAVCLGLAVTVERALAIPHGVWIPMTAAIVLKPDFGGTLSFGALRVAGTLAGLLLTTLIAHYAMDGVVLRLVLMLVLCLAFRLLAQVNYGLGVAMLTGMLVLLLSFEGIAPGAAIELRIACTLGGSALALAAYALWPTWEGRSVDVALATLLDRYRAHINAVLSRDAAALRETRTAARAARTVVQAALERLRAEPRRLRWAATHRPRVESDLPRAESILANANRLIRASLSLEAAVRDVDTLPARVELDAFAARVDATLAAISDALRRGDSVRVPSLRPDERRLADALDAPTAAPLAFTATAELGAGSDSRSPTNPPRAASHDPAAETVRVSLADTCDRIADSVDTLAHLLRPTDEKSSTTASDSARLA